MLLEEARWLAREAARVPARDLSPMLELGSVLDPSSAPQYIESELLAPLRHRGIELVHSNLEPGEGIELVGDLTDPDFVLRLHKRGFRSVMCCNVLEHVPDAPAVASKLEEIIDPGGYLLISVPRRYPFHPDPIDTMFRPTVPELAKIFPRCELVTGEVVIGPNRIKAFGWRAAARHVSRIFLPFVKPRGWWWAVTHLRWLVVHATQTCAVLRRVR